MHTVLKKLFCLFSIFFLAWLGVRLLFPLTAPFLFGTVLALAAEPVVRTLHVRWNIPRSISTGIGVSLTLVLLSSVLMILCAFAVRELSRLAGSLPDLAAPVQSGIDALQIWLLRVSSHTPQNIRPFIQDRISSLFSSGTALLDQAVRYILGLAGSLLSHIPNSALTLGTAVLSAYMISAKLPHLKSQLLQKLPRTRLHAIISCFQRVRTAIAGWLLAQCKLMGFTFLLLLAGFLILRIPNALLLALGTALVDAFPVLGTGTVLIPWSLLRFLQGDIAQGIGLAGIYATVSLVRSGLEPKLLGNQLGIDPLVTLISLYAGFRLWGIGGMILAPLLTVTALQVIPEGKG